jgi:hypothetical protein
MPFKIIQLNSAAPFTIAKVLLDWKDHPDMLASFNLNGTQIDRIRSASNYDSIIDMIKTRTIHPPALNIPGDALRFTVGFPDIKSSPSYNRLMSLWNAYGGIHSLIIQQTVFSTSADPYRIRPGRPYAPRISESRYVGFYESYYYSGILAGYNYPSAYSLWSQGKVPEQVETFKSEYAPADKLIVPKAMINMGSDQRRFAWRYEKGSGIGGGATHFAKTRDYWVIGDMSIILGDKAVERKVEDVNGDIRICEVWNSPWSAPWIEYPDVWDKKVYRPMNSPYGLAQLAGDMSGIEELKETLKLHYDAMKNWFDEGCICDWRDFGFYEAPEAKELKATAAEQALAKATRYQPPAQQSNDPPLDPNKGDMWFDFNAGKLKVYYADDNGKRWMDAY